MFDKKSAVPLHVQLKKLIREQMLSGRLAVHARLPSERELCETYAISRTTVRRAMVDLLGEGLVYTTVGKGTFVAPPPIREELQPLSSFSEDMARRGVRASSQVLRAVVENADDRQAERLHLPRGAEVVVLHRLRFADGFPIAIQENWLPHHLCPGLLRFDLAGRSLYEILRGDYHLDLRYASTGIHAMLANGEQCRLLRLTPPAALLVSEQTTYLENGTACEYTHTCFCGDQYTLFTRSGYSEQRS